MRQLLWVLSLCIMILSGCKDKEDNSMVMESVDLNNTYLGLSDVGDRMVAGDSVRWVCYGNSITFGGSVTYPATLQALLRQHYNNNDIEVINAGQPGWTAPMALGGLDTLVLSHQPDMVSIIFGINDLYQGVSTDDYEAALSDMVAQLQQQGIAVLVMSPTPIHVQQNNSLLNYCIEARNVAAADSVAFFHMHQAMVNSLYASGIDVELLMPDDIHFSNEGYAMIGDTLFNWWVQMP